MVCISLATIRLLTNAVATQPSTRLTTLPLQICSSFADLQNHGSPAMNLGRNLLEMASKTMTGDFVSSFPIGLSTAHHQHKCRQSLQKISSDPQCYRMGSSPIGVVDGDKDVDLHAALYR
ncbi:hypothetical protein L484_025586 [Morus notabilis]|uniref:Uncharacterized protein n=1 Tax=Morus notabilis TaxID=981085 RepID=W9RXD0_9ROSA|nr:hypothetical protein L484_025586 [Morus notabilis]